MATTARVGPTSLLRYFLDGANAKAADFAKQLVTELKRSKAALSAQIEANRAYTGKPAATENQLCGQPITIKLIWRFRFDGDASIYRAREGIGVIRREGNHDSTSSR